MREFTFFIPQRHSVAVVEKIFVGNRQGDIPPVLVQVFLQAFADREEVFLHLRPVGFVLNSGVDDLIELHVVKVHANVAGYAIFSTTFEK